MEGERGCNQGKKILQWTKCGYNEYGAAATENLPPHVLFGGIKPAQIRLFFHTVKISISFHITEK